MGFETGQWGDGPEQVSRKKRTLQSKASVKTGRGLALPYVVSRTCADDLFVAGWS